MTLPALGLIGAGMMGSGMGRCLLAAGYPLALSVHKRRDHLAPLFAAGATEAPSLAALAGDADVLLTCLPKAETVLAIADEIIPHLRAGQIWIDTSTATPDVAETLGPRLAKRGALFVDAPVTGGPPQAQDGTLAALVGCKADDFPALRPLIGAYAKIVRRCGDPGRGYAAKLLNNMVTQGTLLLLADAFHCAGKLGVDADALHEVMQSGAARSGTLEKAVTPALQGKYDGAQFTIENAAKDLRYGRDLIADLAPARAPIAAALADRLDALVAAGRGPDFVSTMLDPARP
ncbi:NAD(P)-dependent oxidoreductase [Aliishimia ponticola]|uniref:NAD(P)-dependent oxidoreductase n=1 Tax=Aliishimia ponticola TaxID=2499833 RepID=A0A4S4NF68_9RHOB|nr:NAD(P)-dependent oxidoreductase [Aliishimia ponticola]THH38212.1 NAD(P)-dependent oxidoreductase [Aliishimia ponticola]